MRKPFRQQSADRRAGGVTMEYVILAVLIAAAVVVAVVVFSRSVATMFITASEATTLRETDAQKNLDMRRKDRDADAKVSKDYYDTMHQ